MTSAQIKARARELGFDACGIAPAESHPELEFLSTWLDKGYGASMEFIRRSRKRRADVRRVVPSARTVIATATLYNTDRPFSIEQADGRRPQVSRYAWGDDYHDVVGRRLTALFNWMRDVSPVPIDGRVCVDTQPVQERVYAQRAGIGWIGKNTCVISPSLGSFVFLGEIICSLPLDVDPPALDQCGSCTLCLEACPTQAFPSPGVLDATRCISFLTIEHRGDIPKALEREMGAHVYGCDVCQEVCPFNNAAPVSQDPAWQPRPHWDDPSFEDLDRLSDADLEDCLAGSPMSRARVAGLRRNIAVAAGNAERPEL